ncbi:Cdc37 [Ophiocordyceps sinensis CO18]|nr:Cdc37 [Ophiocordyceps sinensis CO18]
MNVEEAEEVVTLFGEANILSLQEKIFDATTDEGKKQWAEMEAAAVAAAEEKGGEEEEEEAGGQAGGAA